MTIQELQSKYIWVQLSQIPGDAEFRYQILAPLLNNLYQGKVIYHERFTGIVKLEDIVITPERFKAKAVPHLLLEKGDRFDKYFFKQDYWEVGAKWDYTGLSKNKLHTYGGWLMWCDPETVKKAEERILQKNFKDAIDLISFW